MDLEYQIIKYIFEHFSTQRYYGNEILRYRAVDYSDPKDVEKGNAASFGLKNFPLAFIEWFSGKLVVEDFKGKLILDLGSGWGGRTIKYAQDGKCELCVGMDNEPLRVTEAQKYANYINQKNVVFMQGDAEGMPFPDDTFDYVLSYDVLEHVHDIKKTFNEVYRILKPGGRFASVFPPYYSPSGFHMVRTDMPWMNVFFHTEKIYQVLSKEYGDRFEIRQRDGKAIDRWLNGTTLKEYASYMAQTKFKVIYQERGAIFAKSTMLYKHSKIHFLREILRFVFSITPHIPFLKEYLTHRIVFIVEK